MMPNMLWPAVFYCLTLFSSAFAFPTSGESAPFERLEAIPDGWIEWGDPYESSRLQLRIALKYESREALQQHVLNSSTPGHAQYGKHMTIEELKTKLKPRGEASTLILDWLRDSGVAKSDVQQEREWIKFTAPVSVIDTLLNTTFLWYQDEAGHLALRTTEYWVPPAIKSYIDLIQPTTSFPSFSQGQGSPSAKVKRHELWHLEANVSSSNPSTSPLNTTTNSSRLCVDYVTPTCLRELYNITGSGFEPSSEVNNSIAAVGFLENYPSPRDLQTFQSLIDKPSMGVGYTFIGVNGDKNRENDSSVIHAEGDLDVQYTVALSGPVNASYISTPGRGPLVPDLDQPNVNLSQVEPYQDLIDYLLRLPQAELPLVLSVSYGENEQELPLSYATKVCDGFMQLGALGMSIIVGSGDKGPGIACQSNNGTNATAFTPYFPASCPFVTSVGGTTGANPERAARFSGGGFSNIFPVPSWQQGSVAEYMRRLGSNQTGLFNASGRGIPDVAAHGNNFQIWSGGTVGYITGTSASTPAFAGIIALLNNALLQSNKSPLGFLNPWLYTTGRGGLSDIASGGSTGCANASSFSGLPAPVVPFASWNATQGWDPATGLGSPNFGMLLQTINLTSSQVRNILTKTG
ncbi:MAG: vesicle formation at the endoplasmic reticulum [Vezdaea aestivalis]|nr:MAG: vesicle formation at the endoplasmic reticulum [Vezdaea aestivalis]